MLTAAPSWRGELAKGHQGLGGPPHGLGVSAPLHTQTAFKQVL